MSERPIHLPIWRDRALPAGAKLVAARIEVHARGAIGWCAASVATLAGECGLNVQTVKLGLRALRERGLLTAESSPGRTTRLRLRVPEGFEPQTGPGRRIHPGCHPDGESTQVVNATDTRTEIPSWAAFVERHPELDDRARSFLRRLPWPDGHVPTVATYEIMLATFRSTAT